MLNNCFWNLYKPIAMLEDWEMIASNQILKNFISNYNYKKDLKILLI